MHLKTSVIDVYLLPNTVILAHAIKLIEWDFWQNVSAQAKRKTIYKSPANLDQQIKVPWYRGVLSPWGMPCSISTALRNVKILSLTRFESTNVYKAKVFHFEIVVSVVKKWIDAKLPINCHSFLEGNFTHSYLYWCVKNLFLLFLDGWITMISRQMLHWFLHAKIKNNCYMFFFVKKE